MSSLLFSSIPEHPRPQRRAPVEYSAVVRQAGRPTHDLREFGVELEGSGRARGSQLDVMEDSEVWFTLSTLLPTRIRGARRHLRHDTDPTLLKAFLQFSLEQSREAVAGATSANELAEAVAGTLDGLHSYLVAHDLVGEQYLADEQRLAELILAGESLEGGVASGERAAADPAAANRSDLALAA